ncbi:MAG: hypothetical protein ACE366_08100 [Bradymonadia bacterium]
MERTEATPAAEEKADPASEVDLSDAPPADQAGGIAVPEDHSVRNGLLWVPRVLLFLPRWALELAFVPLRAVAWAFERLDYVVTIFTDFFFTEDRRFGAYPTALFETGFGLNIGARVEGNDLLGYGEKYRLRAGFGGEFRQIYQFRFTSGSLLGDRFNLELQARYNIAPGRPFYGIGNGDITEFEAGDPVSDPLGGVAINTRYRENRLRWGALLSASAGPFNFRLGHIWQIRTFAQTPSDTATVLTEAYDQSRLVGYAEELFNVYNELAITFSTLKPAHPWISRATPSTGWQITTFAGHTKGVTDDPSDYIRTGIDIERYINLAFGDRVLLLRGFIDTTIGTREHIPFDSYPMLGGGQFLRGYPVDRFRDRVAGQLTAEYMYALNQNLATYLFTDIGRVWEEPSAMQWQNMRQTYGGGVQFHSLESFVFRFQVAASEEGDLFFVFNINPIQQTRARF